jgi:8-oxo-dGTP pyrophosphatase MutT (NUDIX family)
MGLPQRIAAGGIIFHGDSVLLVRYPGGRGGGTYLAGPGGGLEDGENIIQAVVREVREETGLTVAPGRPLAIEDIIFPRYKMIKIWMLCETAEGELHRTQGAELEGILEAAWFTQVRLAREAVYPELLRTCDWGHLRSGTLPVMIYPSRIAYIE